MTSNQLKPGNRVLVTTESLCQYEGFFRAVNRSNATFTLTKVRSLGSKDGSHKSSRKVHDCVEFGAADVVSFLALDDGDDGMRSDPAIVSIDRNWSQDSFDHGRRAYHVRRDSGNYIPQGNRSRYQRDFRPNHYRSYDNQQAFRFDRSRASNGQNFRTPQRSHWSQFQQRSPMQREGSFPQKRPGQKNTIGEYDIDKGLEEFSRLKLQDDLKAEKAYDKEESFFDTLATDAGEELIKPIESRRISPRKAAQIDQNVLTFGEDTVRSLNMYRKPSFNSGSYRAGGYHVGRFGHAAGAYQMHFPRNRGNARRSFY